MLWLESTTILHSLGHCRNYLLLVHHGYSSTPECISYPSTVFPSYHTVSIWGMPFMFGVTIPHVFFFSSHHVGHGGKEIVHLQFLTTSFHFLNQFCHRHTLLSSVVLCTLCFSLSILLCRKWCSVVGIFFCWNVCVCWEYIVWKLLFLKGVYW
jgi:hypothetical protein